MYIITGEADGYIKETNGNKCLIFASTAKSKEILQKYAELWNGIKNQIKTINGGKTGEYGKDFINIKFNSDNGLPLNKILNLAVIVRSVFEEDGK